MSWLREIRTWLTNFPVPISEDPSVVVAADLGEISDYLRKERRIVLENFRVVGNCFRFDKAAWNYLREAKDRVYRIAKDQTWKQRNNFLVWSPAGAGKTTYVIAVARDAESQSLLVHKPLDLKHIRTRDELEKSIRECSDLLNSGKSLLVSVDEWDLRIEGEQVFHIFHGPLEWNEDNGKQIIWVFIGSGPSKDALVQLINGSFKGPDVYRRIGDEAGYHINIPALTAGDKVIIAAARASQLGFHRAEATALMAFALEPTLGTSAAVEKRVQEMTRRPTMAYKLMFRDHFVELDKWADFYERHKLILEPLERQELEIT